MSPNKIFFLLFVAENRTNSSITEKYIVFCSVDDCFKINYYCCLWTPRDPRKFLESLIRVVLIFDADRFQIFSANQINFIFDQHDQFFLIESS
jgi:hypothetical protein